VIELQEHQRAVAVPPDLELLQQAVEIVNGGLLPAGRAGRKQHEPGHGLLAQPEIEFVAGVAAGPRDRCVAVGRTDPVFHCGDVAELVVMRGAGVRQRDERVAEARRGNQRRDGLEPVFAFDADDAAENGPVAEPAAPLVDALEQVAVGVDIAANGERRAGVRLGHPIENPVEHQPAPPR